MLSVSQKIQDFIFLLTKSSILFVLCTIYGIYVNKVIKSNEIMNNRKRQYRELSDLTKMKISQKLKGRSKGATHRENISKGMKNYWKTIPNKPKDELE